MRLTRKHLHKLILEEVNLLLEAEPEEETEAEPEEETEAEPEEETEAEPEEEEVYVTPEEGALLSKSADDQIMAFLVDFEADAIKSASLVQDKKLHLQPDETPVEVETEWFHRPLSDILFEEEEKLAGNSTWVGSPEIDLERFSNDVARLIMNYDSLLDMEALIINKAMAYLTDKYDEETAAYFEELLDTRHSMTTADAHRGSESEPEPQHYAAGALAPAGGGA